MEHKSIIVKFRTKTKVGDILSVYCQLSISALIYRKLSQVKIRLLIERVLNNRQSRRAVGREFITVMS